MPRGASIIGCAPFSLGGWVSQLRRHSHIIDRATLIYGGKQQDACQSHGCESGVGNLSKLRGRRRFENLGAGAELIILSTFQPSIFEHHDGYSGKQTPIKLH